MMLIGDIKRVIEATGSSERLRTSLALPCSAATVPTRMTRQDLRRRLVAVFLPVARSCRGCGVSLSGDFQEPHG